MIIEICFLAAGILILISQSSLWMLFIWGIFWALVEIDALLIKRYRFAE